MIKMIKFKKNIFIYVFEIINLLLTLNFVFISFKNVFTWKYIDNINLLILNFLSFLILMFFINLSKKFILNKVK